MQIRDLIPWGRHEDRGLTSAAAKQDVDGHPFLTLHREMNRLFDEVFRDLGTTSLREPSWPSLEVTEDDNSIQVSAELPGMDENDVDVVFENGALTLRGEKQSANEDKARQYSEHYYGRFERVVPIPVAVDEDAIKANVKNGVLTVTLPKSKAQQQNARRISISKT